MKKQILIFFIFIFLIVIGCNNSTEDQSIVLQNLNIVQENVNISNQNTQKLVSGRVFVKSYGTRSESWGIISETSDEIGMGTYNSYEEELRPYLNQDIIVNFSNICVSKVIECCRSTFYYCGTVKSWEINTNSNINQ